MQAVVLVGGRGTRLGTELPKPLAPLGGQPVLAHVLAWLARSGVTEVVMCSGYRADAIVDAIGDGRAFGLSVTHAIEQTPLGTAGAVRNALSLLRERFVVAYGDVIADVDLAAMWSAHRRMGALATLAVHPNDHPLDSDRVIADRDGWARAMTRKEHRAGPEAGALCSAALYVLEREVVEAIPDDGVARDFARDVFPPMCGERSRVLAYRTTEYLKDMGTPERRARVEHDLAHGVPAAMRHASPKPAVFFDRDGVITEDAPYVSRPEELRLLPGVPAALRRLNRAHVLAVLATNQPVVARGELSLDGLADLHRLMEGMIGAEGAWLDALYTCPHHPDRGFAGERPELKVVCECRKPMPGLLNEAIGRLGIDRRTSVFVGDRTSDLRAARAAGVLGIGVLTGTACRDGAFPIAPETPIVPSAAEAVALVLDTAPSWEPWLERVRAAGVVLIGGPSRAGKTVAASALVLALAARGVASTHVSLDRFIVPAGERTPGMTVHQRVSAELAARAARALAAGEHVLLPGYEPRTRARAPSEMVRREGVLVLDGLLACSLELPGALSIAMDAEPEALRARRDAFYAWKGVANDYVEPAVLEDETRAVRAGTDRATLRFSLENARLVSR